MSNLHKGWLYISLHLGYYAAGSISYYNTNDGEWSVFVVFCAVTAFIFWLMGMYHFVKAINEATDWPWR